MTDIFDYPSWKMLDESGNILAAEEVEYFGIMGYSYHRLQLIEPWTELNGAWPMELQLWSGFESDMECSFDYEFVPNELGWTELGPGGCFPVTIQCSSYDLNGTEADVSLKDSNGQIVWSNTMVFGEETSYWYVSDSLCLSQDICYDIQISSTPTTSFILSMADPDPALYFSHWSASIWSDQTVPIDTTIQWDLYGGDCQGAVRVHDAVSNNLMVFPNPTQQHHPVQISGEQGSIDLEVFDRSGRCLERLELEDGRWIPNHAPGLYHLRIRMGAVVRMQSLVIL